LKGEGEGVLGGMIDLREHFGIWDQCGNTRFFRKENPWSEIYLNPLDGVLVVARRNKWEREDPRYQFVVRDAQKAEEGEIEKAYASNQPWVEQAVKRFFYFQTLGWALDAIREDTGAEPVPGDRDLGNFLRFYKAGGERYRKEGHGGEDPPLEEALEAILRAITSMSGVTVDYGRNLSQADLDEALADRGVLECV
jgi:hypothetical protein